MQRLRVSRLGLIQLRALEQDLADAFSLRAVRIVGRFYLGVMLAMDRYPLLGDHAGGHPEPETKEMTHHRVQIEAPMGLCAMEVNCHRGDRDVGEGQSDNDITPPGEWQDAVREKRDEVHVRDE